MLPFWVVVGDRGIAEVVEFFCVLLCLLRFACLFSGLGERGGGKHRPNCPLPLDPPLIIE